MKKLLDLIIEEVGMHRSYNVGQVVQCLERLLDDCISEATEIIETERRAAGCAALSHIDQL